MKNLLNIFKNMVILKKIGAVVVGLIIFGLMVVLGFQIFGTRASDVEPRDVVIADISQNSASISWTTGVETQAVIEYGTSPTALNFFAPEASRERNHKLELTLLSPATTYYFQIRIGDKKYDNGGVPWTFTTKSTQTNQEQPTVAPTKEADEQPIASPTPVQVLEIVDENQPPSIQSECSETDCEKIKLNLGKGCTTQDYFRCLRKATPSPTATGSAKPTP